MAKHFYKVSGVVALGTLMCALSGCSLVHEYWHVYTKDIGTSQREATGYYQHAKAKEVRTELVVPEGLDKPVKDPTLDIPASVINAQGSVGKEMDVRAPVAPLRSEQGLHSQWMNNEAIVWFEPNGAHGITDEDVAWELLQRVLREMQIKVGKVTEDAYELTTMSADFDEFGAPYNISDLGTRANRYRQIYRIRVGRNSANTLGIATQLIGSMTMLAGGHLMRDVLTPIEQERFAMGFSNQIIHRLEKDMAELRKVPDTLQVTLDKDKNGQQSLMVNAQFEQTFNVLKQMLPEYHWKINEYSLSHGTFKVEVTEEDADFYRSRGVDNFSLEDGDYIVRVGWEQGKSVITFCDSKDIPLEGNVVNRIYSGFSQALTRAFARYAKEEGKKAK
ncbi:MAG: outer membrane protein assembly factor BamC [Succinivibrio sp.]|nr:outer membrane protein assembly factor BamC [Succinivibrio sp.]